MATAPTVLIISVALAVLPLYGQDPQASAPLQKPDDKPVVEIKGGSPVKLGPLSLGFGYSRISRGHFSYPGYYHPFFALFYPHHFVAGSLLYPWYGYGSLISERSGTGQIRLSTNVDDARVLLNGGLAGQAGELKKFWLDPGAYDLQIEHPDYQPFSLRLYVLSGKRLKIDGHLTPLGRNP